MRTVSFYELDCAGCGEKIQTETLETTCGNCGLSIKVESWQIRHTMTADGKVKRDTPE